MSERASERESVCIFILVLASLYSNMSKFTELPVCQADALTVCVCVCVCSQMLWFIWTFRVSVFTPNSLTHSLTSAVSESLIALAGRSKVRQDVTSVVSLGHHAIYLKINQTDKDEASGGGQRSITIRK